MDSGWKTVAIRDICDAIYDGPHATPKKTTNGPIFLGISNLQNGQINIADVDHLSEEDYKKWTRRVTPQENDIVFSYETRLGEAALVPKGLRFCLGRRMAIIRPNKNRVYPRFLLYAYRAPEFQQTIKARTIHGSTVDRIPLIEFPNFPISIPSLPDQYAIANILGALDDKIELNRRMNQTLEEIARTVFREWFLENEVIKGWSVGKLGDYIAVNERSITKEYPYSEIEYVDISSVSLGHLASTTKHLISNSPSRARRLVCNGDTIWSTVRPNRKSFLYIHTPVKNLVVSTGFAVLTPKKIPSSFLYFFTTTDQFVDYLVSNADGSAYPAVLPDRFLEAELAVPPEDVLLKYEQVTGPLLARIANNEKESRILADIRDTLLPKLMSGEVRVAGL